MTITKSITQATQQGEALLRMTDVENKIFATETKLFDCFPGGNDTFFVVNTSFEREQYPRINQMVLERYPKFEQGAVLEPSSGGGVVRMQMTGGEFCGNATRSVAALIAETFVRGEPLDTVVNYKGITREGDSLSFFVEVSGADKLVSAKVSQRKGVWDVEIELPRLSERKVSYEVPLEFAGLQVPCTVVQLEGISHILIPESEMPFVNNPELFQTMVADAIAQLSWGDKAAFGLIWVKETGGQFSIEPVVYVKSIQTCIYESACGSGTIAVALASTPEGKSQVVSVVQPSGAVLLAGITESSDTQGIGTTLRGPVEIRGELNEAARPFVANG